MPYRDCTKHIDCHGAESTTAIQKLTIFGLTFAVNGNSSVCILTQVQEPTHYAITRCAPIHKEQIVMVESSVCKPSSIINLLIEPNDCGDIVFPEIWEVGFWGMQWVTFREILIFSEICNFLGFCTFLCSCVNIFIHFTNKHKYFYTGITT